MISWLNIVKASTLGWSPLARKFFFLTSFFLNFLTNE
jgi:hypothetical protein